MQYSRVVRHPLSNVWDDDVLGEPGARAGVGCGVGERDRLPFGVLFAVRTVSGGAECGVRNAA